MGAGAEGAQPKRAYVLVITRKPLEGTVPSYIPLWQVDLSAYACHICQRCLVVISICITRTRLVRNAGREASEDDSAANVAANRCCRANVISYFQWYIRNLAAKDPAALQAAGVNAKDAAPYLSFSFAESVRCV